MTVKGGGYPVGVSRYSDTLTLARFDYELGALLDGDPLHWDLSQVQFVDSYGLVAMACILREFHQRGHTVEIALPQSEAVRHHMGVMDFLHVLEATATRFDLVVPARTARDHGYVVAVREFGDIRSGEELANLIFDHMDGSSYRLS